MELTISDRESFVAGVCAFAVFKNGQRVVAATGTPTAVIRKTAMAGDYDLEIIAEKELQMSLAHHNAKPPVVRDNRKSTMKRHTWKDVTCEELITQLTRYKGNRTKTSRILKINASAVANLIKKYNLEDMFPKSHGAKNKMMLQAEVQAANML